MVVVRSWATSIRIEGGMEALQQRQHGLHAVHGFDDIRRRLAE